MTYQKIDASTVVRTNDDYTEILQIDRYDEKVNDILLDKEGARKLAEYLLDWANS